MQRQPTDFLKLHLIIVIWGFTAILGNLINLPSLEVVFIRSLVAAGILAVMLRHRMKIDRQRIVQLIATGTLIGLHWALFFASVKVANVSICMVGMATISLWTVLLQPLMVRNHKLSWINLIFGIVVVGAVYLIYQSEAQYNQGFLLSIGAAFMAAVFSILNGNFADRTHHHVIAMYEMIGAAIFCGIGLIVTACLSSKSFAFMEPMILAIPTWKECGWLLILASICTVYAYSEYVELLKRLSVFTINFANNLEPVYGIILGALIFQDHQHVSSGFYFGSLIIIASVIIQPMLTSKVAQ